MNRKLRITVVLLVFWSVVIGVPGFLLWKAVRQQPLNHDLIAAIKREDTPAALHALADGADANCRDGPTVSPWQAVWTYVRGLKPGNSNAPTPLLLLLEGEYPRADNPQLVEALLNHGARVSDVDAEGYTPLVYALYLKRSVTARLLIEHCSTSKDRQAIANVLNIAIWSRNDPETIELLLQRGVDPNRPSSFFSWGMEHGQDPNRLSIFSPLETAVIRDDPAIVKCLLRHNADPNRAFLVASAASNNSYALRTPKHRSEIINLLREAVVR